MELLTPICLNNQRVLTTSVLAYMYETTEKAISNNFNRNRNRYIEGKHYFCLEGQSKRDFLNYHQIEDGSKNAAKIYLWTEKGVLLHAKSLNTDRAWNVYDYLVDFYFRAKEYLEANQTSLIKWYGEKPIITRKDFIDFTGEDIRKHKLFFRQEIFTPGQDWNGLGQGPLRIEFEIVNNVHYDEETFIYMYESGVRKAIDILKLSLSLRNKILKDFKEAQPPRIAEQKIMITIKTA